MQLLTSWIESSAFGLSCTSRTAITIQAALFYICTRDRIPHLGARREPPAASCRKSRVYESVFLRELFSCCCPGCSGTKTEVGATPHTRVPSTEPLERPIASTSGQLVKLSWSCEKDSAEGREHERLIDGCVQRRPPRHASMGPFWNIFRPAGEKNLASEQVRAQQYTAVQTYKRPSFRCCNSKQTATTNRGSSVAGHTERDTQQN